MSFLQDLHYGWRNLAKSPGFLLIAVLSLALGIGANTALFSLLYSAVYKSLPVADPQSLVLFNNPGVEGMSMGSSSGERNLMSWREFTQLRGVQAMDGLFATETMLPRLHFRLDGVEQEGRGKMVSGAYFSVLRLQPQIGRFFDESADRSFGASPFLVLSDAFWARRFGRDPSVLGKTLTIQKNAFEIIGVAPRNFMGETVGQNPDFWAPLSMQLQFKPGEDLLNPPPDPSVMIMWLHVFGRLRPGANLAQAQTQADTIFKSSLEQSYQSLSPETKKQLMNQHLKLRSAATGASSLRNRFAESLLVIFAAVGATLLICCANLSNLLLARSNARQREITIRLALGAGRFRVARQLFTEGLVLAALGAVLGLALSQAIAPLLLRMASKGDRLIQLDTSIDWRVLLFTSSIAIATTLICSLLPAIRAAQTKLMTTLREGGRGTTGSHSKMTAGRLFVAAQVALSLLLLVGAGLFLRTLMNLQNVDLGYRKDRLVMVGVGASPAGYKSEARGLLYRNVLEKLRSSPGVRSVTFSQNGLFSGSESADTIAVEGYTARGEEDKEANFDAIGPGYFSALGIPLLQGREIEIRDTPASAAVCVINKAFLNKFFAGRNALGRHITFDDGDKKSVFEIIGVVRDSRDHTLRNPVAPRIFVSLLQSKFGEAVSPFANFEVRTATGGGAALTQLKNAVLAVDRNLDVETTFLSRSIDDEVSQERLVANLVTLFGILALALAAVGIYGILAYGVSQRTNEIGVRMAIGAGTGDVVTMIVRETVWMVSAGLAVGLVASYFLTRLIASRLFGVTATDPFVAGSAILLLVIIGLLAALLPALRASHIDPAIALRNE